MSEALYKKTLSGYAAALANGENLSLSKYCVLHQVNARGLRYWMKKYSIVPPANKSRKTSKQAVVNPAGDPASPSSRMIPLLIQPPAKSRSGKLFRNNPILTDIHITTQSGIVVSISKISHAGLAELILSCNNQ